MPVIPLGVEPFEIRPPVTALDDGQPTDNLLADAQRVFHLIQDERHLTAEDLLTSVQERVAEAARAVEHHAHFRLGLFHHSSKAAKRAKNAREHAHREIAHVQKLLEANAAIVDKLKVRQCGTTSAHSYGLSFLPSKIPHYYY
jgi:hypothetical protein